MTPDVNVLVAAARADHPHHAIARAWLEDALANAAATPLRLMPMVLASFLRLVTSPKIFREPSSIDKAVGFVDALLGASGVELGALGPEWPRLRRLCLEHRLAANALPDAGLAAAVEQQGEHLVTFDRGLRKLLGRSRLTLLPSRSA